MLKRMFCPDCYVRSFQQVDPVRLRTLGIRLLIVDIDNTLIPSRTQVISREVSEFVRRLRSVGIEPVVVSNNMPARIRQLSARLNVACYPFSLKPASWGYRRAMRRFAVLPTETAVLGDQLLTDILGGNRLGLKTILVDPLSSTDNFFGAVNRVLEERLFRLLQQERIMQKGQYYGQL